jgi:hypothetical protein
MRTTAGFAAALISSPRFVCPYNSNQQIPTITTDGSSCVSASLSALEPPAQRRLCFTRTPPRKKAFHADVFVQRGPVDALALTNESPMRPFRLATVRESRVPRQRDAEGPTIDKVDHQSIVGE